MDETTKNKIRQIITENHIIKFFDSEIHAKNLLNKGEMLFNTLEHFAKLEQAGRGDSSEITFKCSGTLYYKKPNDTQYSKLIDFNSFGRDKYRPIYCYTRLTKINFKDNGAMCFDNETLNQLGLDKNSLYGVILDKILFENKVIEYLKNFNIGCDIANIKYTDEELNPQMVLQAQLNKSNLAYFHKPCKFKGQQERRIMLGEHLDKLIERGIVKKFNDGGKIYIGDLSSFGHLCRVVNYPIND